MTEGSETLLWGPWIRVSFTADGFLLSRTEPLILMKDFCLGSTQHKQRILYSKGKERLEGLFVSFSVLQGKSFYQEFFNRKNTS